MTAFLAGSINLLGLIIMMIITIYSRRYADNDHLEQHIFNLLLLVVAVALVSCFVLGLISNQPSVVAVAAAAAGFIYYFMVALAGTLWLLYCDLCLLSNDRLCRRQLLYFIPSLATTVLLVANIDTGCLYLFSAGQGATRGLFYLLLLCLLMVVIASSVLLAIIGSQRCHPLQRRQAYVISYCLLPVAVSVIIQCFAPATCLVAIGWALSLLICFIQQQQALVLKDSLTKLNNHRAFAYYLEHKLTGRVSGQQFFLVMMDADHFKKINDTFGHSCGNEALIKIADILTSRCHKTDFISRLGGDEFTIIG